MKTTELYFPVVLFIMLYKVVLAFESARGWNPKVWPFKCMKATEQYFPVVLFITLHKMILTLSLWLKFYIMAIQMKAIEQ